jgi:hypothetical protein
MTVQELYDILSNIPEDRRKGIVCIWDNEIQDYRTILKIVQNSYWDHATRSNQVEFIIEGYEYDGN